MALEVESPLDSQPKSAKGPLTLKIPLSREISSSRSSSLELSSILPTTSSSSSSLPALNVKFAPLPQLMPRKRRSPIPLGMAARGQLIPRRTGHRQQKVSPVWTDNGPEEYRIQREELAARDARCNAYAAYVAARKEENEDEPEPVYGWHHHRRTKSSDHVDEDPLHALGRIVKVAGKTLWRQVSNKDVAAAAAAAAKSMPKSKGQEDSKTSRSPTSTEACPSPTLRPILGSITSNLTSNVDDHHADEEGLVWDEEIGNSFPLNISQTETIIEGRAVYSRSTSKVEAASRSPPPSPSLSNLKKVLTKPHSSKKVPPPFKIKQGS